MKKSNNYVYLAEQTRFPADKSRKRFSVRSFVAVVRLLGKFG
jgi:hypothetical protein